MTEIKKEHHQENLLLGAHLSISGGFHKALEAAHEINATALQIFTKSSRSWFGKPITEEEIALFIQARKKFPSIKNVIVHAGYLINLGSKTKETEKTSINSLADELKRCSQLELDGLVLHPGSHGGLGIKPCLKQIGTNVNAAFDKAGTAIPLLLETAAGQGTNVGTTFEELAEIKTYVDNKKLVGFCLDTCHVFSAGYDLSNDAGYETMMSHYQSILSLDSLMAIHLNNSKNGCNARLDRHEKLSKGTLSLNLFKIIINDKRLQNVPKILETPIDETYFEYADEIKLLRGMVR